MKKIVRLFWLFLKANASIALTFRASLYAGIFSTLMWVILALISISVLTYQSTTVGGWNKYELFLVQGIYSILLGFMYFMFSHNFKKLSRLIRLGELDLVLTKPRDSQILVSIGEFALYHLARVVVGIVIIIYSLSVLHAEITALNVLGFMLFFVSSAIIIYSLWFSITTLNIWLVDLFNIHELLYNVTGVTRFPLEILRHISRYLMYIVLPLVVVTTVPAQVLLSKLNLGLGVSSVLLAIGLFILSRKFWQFALKYYTSASS